MSALHMTRGLPGSGKSTWAKEWVAENPRKRARVNQDEIRLMLCLGEWTREKEQRVRAVRNGAIAALLMLDLDVVSDDTNLAKTAQEDLAKIAAQYGSDLYVVDFTNVPLYECIRRDAERDGGVGEAVILKMHSEYLI